MAKGLFATKSVAELVWELDATGDADIKALSEQAGDADDILTV